MTTHAPTTAAAASLQLMDVRELAAMLGVNARTVWRLSAMAEAGRGDFPRPLRLGPKTIRWRLADVQAYLSALAGEKAR